MVSGRASLYTTRSLFSVIGHSRSLFSVIGHSKSLFSVIGISRSLGLNRNEQA